MSKIVVQIDNLCKRFGSVIALDGISFQVREGTIFGLLGPNGAGKTTTMKILTTLVGPDAGSARVSGADVVTEPVKVRSLIGYVPQELTVDPYLTAREHLRYYADLYHLSSAAGNKRAADLLELLGLVGTENRRVKTYSGGMKKKLDLACGLIHQPPVIFLDEPSLGLDVQVRREVWNYILKLKERGTTILISTNYMDEAERLCDELAIIDHGKIAVMGTPSGLRGALKRDLVLVDVDPVRRDPEEQLRHLEQAMRGLPMVREILKDGSQLRLYVDTNETALPQILEAARSLDVAIHSISQTRPGLDEVFLQHTGRSWSLS